MKKILFVSTGDSFPNGAFRFLESFQEQEPVCVTGLFFCPLDYELLAHASHVPTVAPFLQIKAQERAIVDRNKDLFRHQCETKHIRYHIHDNCDRWEKGLFATLSRFSDLVLVSGELFCEDGGVEQPNSFLHDALRVAESPVLIVPENYVPVEHLVIGYDGSKDSLFALKQFCYLFPQYLDLPTEMVYVKKEDTEEIPELRQLKEYSSLHFSSMSHTKLHFKADHYFADWIGEKPAVMLVTGSFGRSGLSYATRKSFVGKVIRDHGVPVFIAHT